MINKIPKINSHATDHQLESCLLHILKNNNPAKDKDLSKKCGVSLLKFSKIRKNLERNHVIWGYKTIVDLEKIGLKQYILLLKFRDHSLYEQCSKYSDELEHYAESLGVLIESNTILHGDYDWQISLIAKNIFKMKKIHEHILALCHDSICDIIVLEKIMQIKESGVNNPCLEKIDYSKNKNDR